MDQQQNIHNIRKPSIEECSQAQAYKEKGNQYFKQKSYEEALNMYNLAIEKDPTNSIYYSNKARCLYNMDKFEESLQAAESGIKRDEKNIKAHYLAAESLVKISEGTKDQEKLNEAINRLKRSLTLCPSQGKNQFEANFIDKINRVKKKLWFLTNESEKDKKKAIRKYLVHLVETDNNIDQPTKDQLNQKILSLVGQHNDIDFSKVPQALVCPITKMLLRDPVCNEHGHSYSRDAYIKYLNENGNIDPITNKPIKKRGIMYPNINVKKAVEIFLEDNPWVYDQVVPI